MIIITFFLGTVNFNKTVFKIQYPVFTMHSNPISNQQVVFKSNIQSTCGIQIQYLINRWCSNSISKQQVLFKFNIQSTGGIQIQFPINRCCTCTILNIQSSNDIKNLSNFFILKVFRSQKYSKKDYFPCRSNKQWKDLSCITKILGGTVWCVLWSFKTTGC